jgi:glycosyltransferase involved in cell wall biosynthesis
MKISIITATKNNKVGLMRAIESVRSQTYKDVEHIIVDGLSTDGTGELLRTEIRNQKPDLCSLISVNEADTGIYDAINKGIGKATGDIIGLLHSDDTFANENVLTRVAEVFDKEGCDSVYGDLVYLNSSGKILRVWKSGNCTPSKILHGWMPPHPTLFVRKEIFEGYGLYRADMKIAADYEMILRLFYKYKITSYYLPLTTYCMTIGGASNKSLQNIITKSSEDYRAMKMHSLPFPVKTLLVKNLRKLPQFLTRQ